jgi:hypothetical protein
MVLFDQATYDKLLVEVPKYKLITPSVLSDRLRVSSSHKMVIYWIMLVLPNCLFSPSGTVGKHCIKWTYCGPNAFSCSIDPFFYARWCGNLCWVVNTMSLTISTFSKKTLRSGKQGVPYVFVLTLFGYLQGNCFKEQRKCSVVWELKRIADPLSLNAITSQFFYMVQAIGYVLT